MPRVGDVMIYDTDKTLQETGEFNAQIQTLDIPGEIKLGYSPIGFVRCGRSACRATAFKFKVGKEPGGKKMESPHSLKSNEMAQVSFRPQQPLVVDSFKNCEGLSRIAFLESVVYLGTSVALATLNTLCVGRVLSLIHVYARFVRMASVQGPRRQSQPSMMAARAQAELSTAWSRSAASAWIASTPSCAEASNARGFLAPAAPGAMVFGESSAEAAWSPQRACWMRPSPKQPGICSPLTE